MKLIKIHIDNFGKLSNFDFDFDEKLTSICQDNGQGKTTIATFVAVMLYGMSKNLKEQRDREHFYPFNGGAYGGKLVFSHEGDIYEVRRQFHKSSKAKDTVKISKNSKPFDLPEGREIGEEVLGIDETAFRRVCFIDDNGLDFSQESISSKLGKLAGDFDAIKVELALEKILDEIKRIKPLRGNGGLLGEAESNLTATQNEISRLYSLQQPLADAQREYHEAIEKRRKIRDTISAMQEITLNEERKKAAQSHLTTYQDLKKRYDDLLALYPNGIPTADEIEKIRLAKRDAEDASQNGQDLTPEESERLTKLSIRFVEGAPSQEAIAEINEDIGEYESLNASLTPGANPSEAEEEIVRRFSSNPPNESEVSAFRDKLQSYKTISLEYENTDSTLGRRNTKTIEKKANRPLSIILLSIAAAMVIGGVASCFFLLVLGIVLIIIGLLAAGVGVLLLIKGGKPQQVIEEERIVNPKKQSLGEQKDALRREISTWLSRYYISDPDPISGMAKFESEYRIYMGFIQGQQLAKTKKEETENRAKLLKGTIDSFFTKYGYHEQNYRAVLLALQKDVADYDSLKQRKQMKESADSKKAEIKKKAEETIKSFCAKYNVKIEDLDNWLESAKTAEQSALHIQESIDAARITYEQYIQDNPIQEIDAPEATMDDLKTQEAEFNKIIVEKRNTIDNWERDLEALDGLLHDEDILKRKIADLKRRHKILSCVKKDIEYAQNVIKEKYVGPIKKEFEQYIGLIRETSGLIIDLDADLELKYYANGEYRKSLHLSDGEKMLVSFCLRLALLKNMYKGSEIFAILDDPFVSLDDNNLPRVLNSLKKLNDSTQILYFTCHKSRMPK